jgi:multiple sugar transport system permease protein
LLVTPLTLFLFALLALPTAIDLLYSVSHVTFETLRAPRFSGLANFADLLGSSRFWSALWFSVRFSVIVAACQVILGTSLAIFLAPLLTRHPWLLAPLMLPMMVAPALVGLMYRLILHEFVGVLPYYLEKLTGDSPAFLAPRNAFWTLVVIETLQWMPFALLIAHTAHRAIGPELRDAAGIDGAGALALLTHIELPLMAPTLVTILAIRLIDSFRVFDNVYVLTGSGAGGSTTTISIFIYEAFFRDGEIGAAVAACLLLLVLVGGAILPLLLRRSA